MANFFAQWCRHRKHTMKQQLKNIVTVPNQVVAMLSQRPLLRGLITVAAGFSQGTTDPLPGRGKASMQACFVYCLGGCGWYGIAGRLHSVRPGDLVVLPLNTAQTSAGRASHPWSLYWVCASGDLLDDYVDALTEASRGPISVGEDPQLVRLFNEILRSLQAGTGFPEVLRASNTLAHLLAVLIEKRQQASLGDVDTTEKIAEAIIYMSEHLDEPVRISTLARSASLSPAYFSALFKQQTSCAPRDYLHLLRIHRSCQLLRTTDLSVKQVAARVGYQDQFHFSRQFKAFNALSPTEYRASRTG
jgi:AraC-like DNA-binding protein